MHILREMWLTVFRRTAKEFDGYLYSKLIERLAELSDQDIERLTPVWIAAFLALTDHNLRDLAQVILDATTPQ